MPLVRDLLDDARIRDSGDGAHLLSTSNPMGLVDELRGGRGASGGTGRIFHDQALGGWLEFHLTGGDDPRPVAFVDQRMELIPAEVWADYFTLSEAAPGWQALAARYELRRFVLHTTEQRPLMEALLASDQWQITAVDAKHVLIESSAHPR